MKRSKRPGEALRVALFAYPEVQALDLSGPLEMFARATRLLRDEGRTHPGYSLAVVGTRAGPITSSSGLSKEEVERMAKEADAHAAEDKAQRDAIDAKNQLDSMLYNVEKMLRENGDKISGSERGDVENAVADAKKALESNEKAQMDGARDRLQAASHKLAEAMYKNAQAAGGAQPGAGGAAGTEAQPGSNGATGGSKPEGVIDAEYVDVEEKK